MENTSSLQHMIYKDKAKHYYFDKWWKHNITFLVHHATQNKDQTSFLLNKWLKTHHHFYISRNQFSLINVNGLPPCGAFDVRTTASPGSCTNTLSLRHFSGWSLQQVALWWPFLLQWLQYIFFIQICLTCGWEGLSRLILFCASILFRLFENVWLCNPQKVHVFRCHVLCSSLKTWL